ncbi:hypothetical protein [Geomobilimonas luticola]|uniref:Zinc finger/thioredoxin putative domain-containing protein n=1 Tax=Geomobilimonas luticola TaxID=1114878 RepID=A0ABS5SG16_9BACT|nr:hypothetical protein [Geomobilimonas luticola]MBT0654298.1 hypothetical protein [Geomobilimonas luticola]
MKCICPKCHAKIQVVLPQVPEEGTTSTCTECKGRFLVYQESFGARALRKTGEISCVQCGNELGPSISCAHCGALFPEYYVVQSGLKRTVRKTATIKEDGSSLRPAKAKSTLPLPGQKSSPAVVQPLEKSPKLFLMIVGVIALLALMVGGGTVYNNRQKEQKFAKNYVVALYGIKSGSDMSLAKCAKLSADWKAKLDGGLNFTPRISPEDESDIDTVKNEIDAVMQKLTQPPRKYTAANEKLNNLYGVYTRMNANAMAPSSSWSNFNDSTNKLENDFNAAAQDLKSNLPEGLKEEVRNVVTRYKSLKFIIE